MANITFANGKPTGEVTFYYYTQDYLGNNRAVVNGTTGAVEQSVAYYPYGGVIANLGMKQNATSQKFEIKLSGRIS